MFEQTLIVPDEQDKKRYTVLLSLLLQVGALGLLTIAPLIYTQILPPARLRSVFAAPTPPPPALPKAPARAIAAVPRPVFRPSFVPLFRPLVLRPGNVEPLAEDAPAITDGVVGGDSLPAGTLNMAQLKVPEAPPQQQPIKPMAVKRLRVTEINESQLIHRVQPAYPAMALRIRIQGTVEFTAVIGKAGTIENLQLVSGHPLLVAAARDALLQWRYKPTLLNGEPVEVVTDIRVSFKLNEQ